MLSAGVSEGCALIILISFSWISVDVLSFPPRLYRCPTSLSTVRFLPGRRPGGRNDERGLCFGQLLSVPPLTRSRQ
jgi:hypothetical protein